MRQTNDSAETEPAVTQSPPSLESAYVPETPAKSIWNFNGTEITDNHTDRISDSEMAGYRDGFQVFQRLFENADNHDEQIFLSSPRVFALCLGLNSELQMSTGDGMMFFKNARKLGLADRFMALQYEDDFDGTGNKFPMLMVYNRQGTEAALRSHAEQLGLQLPDRKLSRDELSDIIKKVYDPKDGVRANRARGAISGFPDDAVNWFLEQNADHLPQMPVHDVTEAVQTYIDSDQPGSLQYRPDREYYKQSFKPFDGPSAPEDKYLTIDAMGVAFKSPKPMTRGIEEHCDRMMEIARRLRLTDYLQAIKQITSIVRH